MDKNIQSYIQKYALLDSATCAQIVQDIGEKEWHKHQYNNSQSGKSLTYDNDLSVTWDSGEVRPKVMQSIWDALQHYVNDLQMPWFNGWNGYSPVRFNRYEQGQEMRTHCDHISTVFTSRNSGVPVLTVLGGLNDDYKGGEFILWEDTHIEIPAGTLLVFPSNFLYPHKVLPVTHGTRYSFVSWAW